MIYQFFYLKAFDPIQASSKLSLKQNSWEWAKVRVKSEQNTKCDDS